MDKIQAILTENIVLKQEVHDLKTIVLEKELETKVLKESLSEKDTKDQTIKGIHRPNAGQEVWTE